MIYDSSPIPHNEWVTMPQYDNMQYMYSPPTAQRLHDDGFLKMRLGNYKTNRRIAEYILQQGDLAETVWAACESFYTRYQYDVAHGRGSSYSE